jgi:rhodanese-related sulfurtransferase
MQTPWWLPFGDVPGISPAALARALATGTPPQLLDVRSPGEFAAGHLPGAVNVPITELAHGLQALPFDKQRPVVAICLSAHRSIPAVRLLSRAGFVDVRQLEGGMLAYRRLEPRPQTTA